MKAGANNNLRPGGVTKRNKMEELKAKIEAILYCTPQGITLDKIARAVGIGSKGHVKNVLKSLQEDFDKRDSGLRVFEAEGTWRLGIKDEHIDLVRDAARPELDKAVLETLAYIAHKKNVSQASVVKIRSNKAYEHIKELEEKGFIEGKKNKRTKVLSPTKRFYEYFQLEEERLELPKEDAESNK